MFEDFETIDFKVQGVKWLPSGQPIVDIGPTTEDRLFVDAEPKRELLKPMAGFAISLWHIEESDAREMESGNSLSLINYIEPIEYDGGNFRLFQLENCRGALRNHLTPRFWLRENFWEVPNDPTRWL